MQQYPTKTNKQPTVESIDYSQAAQEQLDCSQPEEEQVDCPPPEEQEEDCEQNAPDRSTSTKTVLKWVSIIQMVNGILSIICGIVLLCLPSSHHYRGLTYIGYGIWIGGVFVMTGALGINATKKEKNVITFVIWKTFSPCTTYFTIILSIVLLALTSIGLSEITAYKTCDGYSCPPKNVYDTFVAMYSIHILIALTNLMATIWVTCLRCKGHCRKLVQANIAQQQRIEAQKALHEKNMEIVRRHLEMYSQSSAAAPAVPGAFGAPAAPGAFGAHGASGAFGATGAPGAPGAFGGLGALGASAAPGVFGAPGVAAAYQHQQQYSPYPAGAIPPPVGHTISPPAPPSYSSLAQSEAVADPENASALPSEAVSSTGYTQHAPVFHSAHPQPTKQ